jgi:nucleolar protein 56
MVGAMNDIESSLNLIKERITEWLAKYWTGTESLVENRTFLEAMRDDPDISTLHERLTTMDPSVVQGLEPPGEVSADLGGISSLCTLVISLAEARERMEASIGSEMRLVAPNLAEVVGPLIGARLIHSAGGLERLSRLPASTVQVLGAEKMFFKFLKEGGKPPKHGVLFQHPWVHSLPAQKRGRMARSMASAASIASRLDANGGSGVSEIKKRLERRALEIKSVDKKKAVHGGRQPPFREGWWADKGDRRTEQVGRGEGRWRRDARRRRSG